MPWKPSEPGERPTLGWDVLDWITEYLAAPDRAQYEPFEPTQEQAEFILRFYEINPVTGKRLIRRGVISRPRGWGKSPFLAALAAVEGLAEVVPDGWDADGRPIGKPWGLIRTPLVQVAAVSEEQTKNSWSPLLEMLRNGPVMDEYPGLEVMETFVNLPQGRIETITSSAQTVKGNRAVFAIMDQTEEWTKGNGGHRLSQVMVTNATKVGGTTIESPNAFTPGMDSVAERTANAFALMTEGKTRNVSGLLYDHREAPPETDVTDRESLLAGLRYVYGDSAEPNGWVDLNRVVEAMWDTDMDPQLARADYLNQITHASDSWLSQPEWAACADPTKVIADRDVVVLGFDGSRKRSRGVTDATALVGCRVSDGHLFEVEVWEQPQHEKEWRIPSTAVDATVRAAFRRWNVVGFYADPALWEGYIAQWEAAFSGRLKVKAARGNPIEWLMNRPQIVTRAIEQLHSAIIDGEMTHDGSSVITRHMLNARRRNNGTIGKDFADSPRKIDAAYAAVLAWQARLDALAAGLGRTEPLRVPSRIR